MTPGQTLRVLGELVGGAVALFALSVGFVAFFAYGPVSPFAFYAGYALLPLALPLLRRWRPIRLAGRRLLVDLWLAAAAPALLLVIWAHDARWPLRGERVDAHGWGTTGGEGNLLLLSWLHVLFWLVLVVAWGRRSARAEASTAPPSGASHRPSP